MLKLTLLLLTMMVSSTNEDEKFLPPRIAHMQAVGCEVVADKTDMQAYVEVLAKHDEEPGWDYRVIISKRDSAQAAFKDCVKWYNDLGAALTKEQASK